MKAGYSSPADGFPLSFFQEWDANRLVNPHSGVGTEYKVQIHCHSSANGRDSVKTSAEVMNYYKAAGYNAVAITNHGAIATDPEVADILWIPAYEQDEVVPPYVYSHVNVLDPASVLNQYNPYEQVETASRLGKVIHICHPTYKPYDTPDKMILSLGKYTTIEIYGGYWGYNGETKWDLALSNYRRCFGAASDDAYIYSSPVDYDKAWIIVRAASLTKTNILNAILAGDFYASGGNVFTSIVLVGDTITAVTPANSNFEFIGRNGAVFKTENGVTTSSYTIVGNEMYIRIRAKRVSDNMYAWSQPIIV